jgi:predicted metal-dependent hydrolase
MRPREPDVPPRLPRAFLDGVRLFNSGSFFEAHEAFEGLLDEVEADERWDLLVALVQVAVGYHKCASGHPGAAKMLGLGLEKLEPFAADAGGVALDALRARVRADRDALAAGVPARERLADPPRIALARTADWSR